MKLAVASLFLVLSFSLWGQSPPIRPVQDLPKTFMMGADVSMLDQLESLGAKFSDSAGHAADPLALLKAGGVNWIRLRLWVDPVNREDVVDNGKTLSKTGDPVGGGNNTLAAFIRTAQKAKKLGLHIAADFHYSDFWADPSKQPIPFAWKDLSASDLKKAVYAYTKDSLAAMKKAGVLPELVQVGNEVDNGFMWPAGKIYPSGDEKVGGRDGFIALLKEGIRAVRDTDRKIRVMIHLSNGGDNALYHKFFDPVVKAGVDFDIIGLSFYPYWHGKIDDLSANLTELVSSYNKQLIVAETAYAWTTDNGDSMGNSFGTGLEKLGGYKATVQGQASAIADVIGAVAGAPDGKGIGVFYWEPDWVPVAGAGWRTGDGNSWENQALFDFQGRALPSLGVFKAVAAGGDFPDIAVTAIDEVAVEVAAGGVLELPKNVLAAYSDDSYRLTQVKWTPPDAAALQKPGTVLVQGAVWGYSKPVVAKVSVVIDANLIKDSSFESGGLTAGGWTVTGPGASASTVEKNPGNSHKGDWSFKYWADKPFQFTLSKKFDGLKNGTYTFHAWAAGGGGEKAYSLFVRGYGGPDLTTDITDTGWQKWKLYEIKGVVVKNGVCEIGVSMDGAAGNWGNVDDVVFVRDGD